MDGREDRLQKAPAVGVLELQLHLAALDPGQIQRVVHEIQQQLAGEPDLLQIFLLPRGVRLLQRKVGKAQDAVERRAQIVAHAGEERGLRLVGPHRGQLRGAELLDLPLRGFVLRGDVAQAEEDRVAPLVEPGKDELLAGGLLLGELDGEGVYVILLAFELLRHRLEAERGQKRLCLLQRLRLCEDHAERGVVIQRAETSLSGPLGSLSR
jgi:hypothetical protein